jgi:hypothetical protein
MSVSCPTPNTCMISAALAPGSVHGVAMQPHSLESVKGCKGMAMTMPSAH